MTGNKQNKRNFTKWDNVNEFKNQSLYTIANILLLFIFFLMFIVACKSTHPAIYTATPTGAMITKSKTPISTIPSVKNIRETSTFSPTPALSATLSVTNTVTSTPSPMQFLQKVQELPISTFDFTVSDDGTLLAYEDENGVVHVFNTSNWETKWEIEEENRGMVGYMVRDFSPDGKFLAGAGIEQDVFVWDMITGKTVHAFPVPYDEVNNISFSPDGKLLAISAIETCSAPEAIMIWNIDSGQLVSNQVDVRNYVPYVMAITFIPNQENLLAVSAANLNSSEEFGKDEKIGGLFLWDISNHELQEVAVGTGGTLLTLSPDGQILIVSIDDYFYLWDVSNKTEIARLDITKLGGSRAISLSNTGLIANANADGLSLWNLQGELLARLATEQTITDIKFFPNGNLLIAYGYSKPMDVWKINE